MFLLNHLIHIAVFIKYFVHEKIRDITNFHYYFPSFKYLL